MSTFIFSDERIFNPELRSIRSIYRVHISDNDIYDNKTDLLALEYRPVKNFRVYFGYFKNSFYNDSYVLGTGKYLRLFESFNNFYFTLGVGIVKGYNKVNYIYDHESDKVVKKI